MSNQSRIQSGYGLSSRPAYDPGLRAYLLRIYNYMTVALGLTGLIAYLAAHSEPFINLMYVIQGDMIVGTKPLAWIIMFAPLALVVLLSFRVRSMSLGAVQLTFWSYAALIGLSLSVIFLAYTDESVASAFFITAGMFAGMSFIGYTTKTDLRAAGSFLLMCVIGILIASLVNMLIQSPGFQYILSIATVLVFAGLTAADTQKLKLLYDDLSEEDGGGKIAIMGALTLYLDFLNIFMSLLRITGRRRR